MSVLSRLARGALGALVTSLVVACSGEPSTWLQTSAFNQVFAAPREGEWLPSSAGAYLVGRYALDAGDVETATAQFTQALKADPENPELLRQVFVLKLADGIFDVDAARAVLATDPAVEEARLLVALAAAKRGDYAGARRQLQDVGGRGLGAIVVPLLTAWALYGEGSGDAARLAIEGPVREDGFATLRAYHRAALTALRGDPAAARAIILPLVDDPDPAPVRLAVTAAVIDVQLGDLPAAKELLRKQQGFFDGNPILDDAMAAVDRGAAPTSPIRDATTGMADALLSLAAALQEQGLDAQAIIYARLATFMDPSAGDAWLVVARGFSGQSNPRQAVRVLDQVPADSTYRWNARLARAEALAQLDRIDEAAAEFRAMSAERPQRVEPLVALGDMLRGKERFGDAVQAYSEALRRVPAVRPAQWRLLYARGIALERTDRWPEAEADFLAALELQPEQPYVLNYLGYSWVDKGRNLDRAKGMLHRAVELRPEDGYIVDSLGWAYFKLGEHAPAVEQLERAVELQPGDPVINDHLGDAYWRVGREREARFQWKRALSLKPEQGSVAAIEKKLVEGLPAARPGRG